MRPRNSLTNQLSTCRRTFRRRTFRRRAFRRRAFRRRSLRRLAAFFARALLLQRGHLRLHHLRKPMEWNGLLAITGPGLDGDQREQVKEMLLRTLESDVP